MAEGEADLRSWLERAREAVDTGRYGEALEAYRNALDAAPTNEDARMGVAQLELIERVDQSVESEMRARLEADPVDVGAAIALADLSAARGNVEGACMLLLDVVARSTGNDRDQARLHTLRLLDTLPDEDRVAAVLRRKLAALL